MKNKNNVALVLIDVLLMIAIIFTVFALSNDKELQKEVIEKATDLTKDLLKYEMTEEEIKELPSTEIQEQTQEDEQNQEQEVEDEGFELQGKIAYDGDRATTWDIELGNYKGLTYYSQLDNRWKDKVYSSIGNVNQTIGSSGCRTNLCKYGSNSDKGSNNA